MRSLLQQLALLVFGKLKAPRVACKPAILRIGLPNVLSLPAPQIPARYHVRIDGTLDKNYQEAELIGSLREAMGSQALQLVLHNKLGYLGGGVEVIAMK
ncbi:hypothetical protein NLJ89_g11827 [Agrocybe chaxingu]|uniref:Uncharacterized protein n=1 Tax=Agrocybe chaxingu TaxID=84603 RepID=A0A9W8JL77_9AGAR|nr:hypothetical protein NLJ89_g11827 [Agrocybe chaxingu]